MGHEEAVRKGRVELVILASCDSREVGREALLGLGENTVEEEDFTAVMTQGFTVVVPHE